MRQKIITALSLVIVFAVIFSAQLSHTAYATTKNGNPVTSPVTFFQISGKVTYKFFKLFGGGSNQNAAGVEVEAKNVFTNDVYETTTDANGNYVIPVQEKGVFLVGPTEGNTDVWVPALKPVHANNPGSKTGVNFQGFILP